ncbi:MAG TPA: HDIG domain-containing protein [Anaerolineae bacterium]|nr:HDIG domain-containing protein [Anaerolineae bacterium]
MSFDTGQNGLAAGEPIMPLTARRPFRILLFSVLLVVALSFVLTFQFLPRQLTLEVGDVSPRDIRAPARITYVSDVETGAARHQAELAVPDVYDYDPADTTVAREQINHARKIFDYVAVVRHDAYATSERKTEMVSAIPDLDLSPTSLADSVSLEDELWDEVTTRSLEILGEVMDQEIRADQLTMVKDQLHVFEPDLTEPQAALIEEWVAHFIVPNSFPNPHATEEAKVRAREAVEPVYITLEEGQTIVREGEVTSDIAWEALVKLRLLQPQVEWSDIAARILFISLLVFILALYLTILHPSFWANWRDILLLGVMVTLSILVAKLMIPGHVVLGYLFPLAAASMLLTTLVDTEIAIVVTAILSPIIGLIAGGSLEFAVYSFAGGVAASLRLWRTERLNAFLWAGVYAALSNLSVVLVFRALEQDHDLLGTLQIAGASVGSAVLAMSLTLGGFFLLSNALNITTSLQLLELGRPTHPLLSELLMKAPGTYHHSLMVGNMAEQAAQAVGANPLLARVGAYYHDIGKMLRPYFFAENQTDGENPHDRLDPETSAQIITSHVKDGLQLAKKHRLPNEIQDFIPQHHGTAMSSYFYHQACAQNGGSPQTDKTRFRYPGPRPRTREAAILMLADEAEAASRANRPRSVEEIEELVDGLIQNRVRDRQLDDSDLTLRDLQKVRETLVTVLQGSYHPRIKYPEDDLAEKGEEEDVADRPRRTDRSRVRGRRKPPTSE